MFTGKSKERTNAQARYRALRTVAGVTASSMAWLIAGPSVAAGVQMARTTKPQGHTRALGKTEMAHIFGTQGQSGGSVGTTPIDHPADDFEKHQPTNTPSSGGTFPWEGSYNQINTGNGNKQTALPIVSWKARGGRLGVNLSLTHNSQGNHNSELGHKWTHSYDIYLMPGTNPGDMTVHWGDDLSYTFAQNITSGFDAPVGIHDVFAKTGSGTSATYDLTTKDQIVYHFAYVSTGTSTGDWYCTSITDRNNNAITIAHNSAGMVTSVTDPTSRAITFSYTSGKLTGISDPISRSWTLHYDSNDDLTSVDLPAVGSTTYSVGYGYNANHDITSITDPRGKVWTNSYYSDNAIEWEKDPLGNKTDYLYTSGYTKITNPRGYSTKQYYTSGKLTSVVDQAGETESYGYDAHNNKNAITDRRGKSWSFTYDSMGNCLTQTDPLSHTITYTYNSKNNITSILTALGHQTDYVYNTAGNLTSVTDALLHTTSYGYDAYGQLTTVADPLSHTATTGYDTDGNATSISDGLSHTVTMGFDGIGRQTSVTDATGLATTAFYDALNRVTSITAQGGRTATFVYDGGSTLRTSVTDPMANVNTYSFDDAGRPISHTDANTHTVYSGYDAAGNKTSFTDGNGHTTSYSYTSRNELAGIYFPDGTSASQSYNASGTLLSKTDGRGVTATNSFDDAGKPTGTSYNDGVTSAVSFSYDSDNRKTGMSDGTGTYSYSFDDANRMTQRATPNGTVSFGYDNANRMTSRTLGAGITTLSYDNANRLISLTAPGASASETTTYTFNNADRLLTTTLANGDVQTNSYSSTTGELTSVVNQTSASATISSHAYTYRADGRKTGETLADGSVVSYGYDNAGQLTSESKVDSSSATIYSQSFTYDDAGNRASKTGGSTTELYTYDDANKLLAAGDKTYDYDYAGNVSSVTNTNTSVTTDLTWDGESRMTSISDGVSVNATYSYNGLGQRVSQVDSANNTFIYTHQDDAVDSPLLSDGAATYTQGMSLVSEVRSGASKFYQTDGAGSTRAITSSSGTTTDTIDTDAFGNVMSATGSTPTPFGYSGNFGYKTDSDTGLMLVGYRYYDASTGRFLSRDPIEADYNWYTYCQNDPVNAVDPLGLQTDFKIGKVDVDVSANKDGPVIIVTIPGVPPIQIPIPIPPSRPFPPFPSPQPPDPEPQPKPIKPLPPYPTPPLEPTPGPIHFGGGNKPGQGGWGFEGGITPPVGGSPNPFQPRPINGGINVRYNPSRDWGIGGGVTVIDIGGHPETRWRGGIIGRF